MLITTTKPIRDIKIGDIVFLADDDDIESADQLEVVGVQYPNDSTIRLMYSDDNYSDAPIDAMVITKNQTMRVHMMGSGGRVTQLQ